ncbi:MAG: flavodoxin-dependent (E)-4-hydroxy-3-methylbut-2-enyl-diphosphate synthase [Synergistaceae bacterium]|nr:flavodoxin-dependent (E)-4-hydroxy-3-methylbut-2-enyl-diphosphate synthase [Synergistaceae bacterium]
MASIQSVKIGNIAVGGKNPIRVESMLKTRLTDVSACIESANKLHSEGCEIIRIAFPDISLKDNLAEVVKNSRPELMADIHFDPKLALAAIEAGLKSIRINPGNMTQKDLLSRVIETAKDKGVVIRIGANGGSLNNAQLAETNGDRSLALFYAVDRQAEMLLSYKFDNMILSAKSSNIADTVRANYLLSQKYPFPFHIGITEAGSDNSGVVQGAIGISQMLAQGIGDTIRVSLSDDPSVEVETGYNILQSLGLRSRGWKLISCPTCGRRRASVVELVKRLRNILSPTSYKGLTIAVMGCEVNGPKEASGANLGVAGSPDGLIIFKKGKFVERISESDFENKILSILKTFE